MKKYILLTICIIAGTTIQVYAQSPQDSAFLKSMISQKNLTEGKAYLLESKEQAATSEYTKSPFLHIKAEPEFGPRGEILNGLPYTIFGKNPIVFEGYKEDKIKIKKKKTECYTLYFSCKGVKYKTVMFTPPPYARSYFNLIEENFLLEAKRQLEGKTLYTQTASWWKYHPNETSSNNRITKVTENTCKYCPVVVTQVMNDYDDKYLVFFHKEGEMEEYCFDNVEFNYQTINRFLNFTQYFTFANPQEEYSTIEPERWQQIMSQQVKKGFTKQETKIAFGEPDRVLTEDDDEIWYYFNHLGKAFEFTFKNGVIDKVRSDSVRY